MRKLTSTRHETPELPIKRHLNADIWLSLERSRAVQGFDLSQDFSEGRPFQGILGPTGLAPHHFWECLSKESTKAKCTVDYKSALIELINISSIISIFSNSISCRIVSHHFIHCLKDNFHLRTLAFWKKDTGLHQGDQLHWTIRRDSVHVRTNACHCVLPHVRRLLEAPLCRCDSYDSYDLWKIYDI